MIKHTKLLALFLLYSFASKSLVFGILAVPIYFQWEYFQGREFYSSSRKMLAQVFCQTFAFGLFLFLYSQNNPMNSNIFKNEISIDERALISASIGFAFAILVLVTEMIFKKTRKGPR